MVDLARIELACSPVCKTGDHPMQSQGPETRQTLKEQPEPILSNCFYLIAVNLPLSEFVNRDGQPLLERWWSDELHLFNYYLYLIVSFSSSGLTALALTPRLELGTIRLTAECSTD